ncbi:Xaa-Pro aminopeptidase 1 [Portunus trituberculatus]|uniref:Xaa-Pro aminopeptidase 1 n=1 Tax=Portunus trituberculatus TaxID=210409 RepID=A0A5B7DZQ2_PORTR|nr:Xaa-Pro aminopeptidase 1 [Portunus trituberculatus]
MRYLISQSPLVRKPLPRVRKPNLHSDREQDSNPCAWRPPGPQSTHGSTYHFDKQSLGFEPVTLVPFEPRLINTTLLSARQCRWINAYHARVRDVVGGELIAQGRRRGYDWVVAKTEPIPCISGYAGPSTGKSSSTSSSSTDNMAALTVTDLLGDAGGAGGRGASVWLVLGVMALVGGRGL